MLRSSHVYRTTRHSKLKLPASSQSTINRGKIFLVYYIVVVEALFIFRRTQPHCLHLHSGTAMQLKNNMNANSTKAKNESLKMFTFPLSPIQSNLCNLTKPQAVHTPPNGDNLQQKNNHNNVALHSNTSLQSSIPLDPAFLPAGLILVKKSSAVISQQTSLLTNSGININMSLTQISVPNFCHIISQCIKLQVFCSCKFYNKEHHGTYNKKPMLFCGIVLKYCNNIANKAWWYNTRKMMIVFSHTNHCNNCIKAVKLKFKGTQFEPETHQFSNVNNIVQCEIVHYQKDAPNQPQHNDW